MSATRNAAIVSGALRSVEAGNFESFASYLSDDFRFVGPFPEPMDRAHTVMAHQSMVAALPDWKFNDSDVATPDDNTVTAVISITGTHTGTLVVPMPGIPEIAPTGVPVNLPSEHVTFTIRDGRITELIAATPPDGGLMGLLKQVGVDLPEGH